MENQTDAAPFSPGGLTIPKEKHPQYADEVETPQDAGIEFEKGIAERKFNERKKFKTEKDEYERDRDEPGKVLIFNQEENRTGSRRDVNEVILTFQKLGFNISKDDIISNGTRDKILNKLQEVKDSKELKNANSLIIFFFSHGQEGNLLDLPEKQSLKTSDIWEMFKDCEALENKPKLFVFQACKGAQVSTTSGVRGDTSPLVRTTFNSRQQGQDMLIVYSTIEDKVAFRHPTFGSWFIQELCKNFSNYGKRDDVVSLLIRTTKCTAGSYYTVHEGILGKQMPIFISTLKKKFYLNRNKDRHILLKIVDDQETIIEKLDELNKKMDGLVKTISDSHSSSK